MGISQVEMNGTRQQVQNTAVGHNCIVTMSEKPYRRFTQRTECRENIAVSGLLMIMINVQGVEQKIIIPFGSSVRKSDTKNGTEHTQRIQWMLVPLLELHSLRVMDAPPEPLTNRPAIHAVATTTGECMCFKRPVDPVWGRRED